MERTMEAAFFDLDKTIISRSSSLALSRPLYRAGMVSRGQLMRGAYAQLVYLLVGADEQKMERLKGALLALTKGWDRAQVEDLVREVLLEVIDPYVYQEALDLIALHRSEGRSIYIVSSSPEEVVRPLARHFGASGVIATRAAVDAAGRYTGELAFYAYGKLKADAIGALAGRIGHRPRRQLRLQRLGHRRAHAGRRRPPHRGQPRQGIASHGRGARLGDQGLPASGSTAQPHRAARFHLPRSASRRPWGRRRSWRCWSGWRSAHAANASRSSNTSDTPRFAPMRSPGVRSRRVPKGIREGSRTHARVMPREACSGPGGGSPPAPEHVQTRRLIPAPLAFLSGSGGSGLAPPGRPGCG